jgi:uncharacterized membrane protein HdeD (DUF308 family)
MDSNVRPLRPLPPPPEQPDVDTRGWWGSVAVGVCLVGLGVWMLSNLYESVVVLASLAGLSLIIGGLVEGVALGGRHTLGWAGLLGGAGLVVAGVVVLAWPEITLWVLAVVAGLVLVTTGSLRMTAALANRDCPGWGLDFGLAVLSIATGTVVVVWPQATLLVLAVLLGLRAVGTGLVAIGVGWRLHRLSA